MEQQEIALNQKGVCYTCLSCENLAYVPKNHQEYNEFVKMFYTFTSIEITENAIVICGNCVSKLNESLHFRKTCIDSYRTLQFLQLGDHGSKNVNIQDSVSVKALNSQDINPYKEDSCSTNDLKVHIRSLSSSKTIVCGLCSQEFENIFALFLHSHINNTNYNKDQEEPIVSGVILKEDCSSNNFICSKCGKCFALLIELKKHIKDHINIKKSEKSVSSVRHQKISNFTCSVCNKSFSSRFMLNRHGMSHSGKKPYQCSSCPNTFYSAGDLNVHMRVHTGEKPYVCSVCNKPFRRTSHLTIHMRVHTGERPYECKTCGKSFAQSGDLRAHERIHTGEKPFTCNFCEKCFAQRSALKTHLKRHFNATCTNCKNTFMNYPAFKEHQEICKDEMLY